MARIPKETLEHKEAGYLGIRGLSDSKQTQNNRLEQGNMNTRLQLVCI